MSLQSFKDFFLAAYVKLSDKQVSAVWVVAAGLVGLILGFVL